MSAWVRSTLRWSFQVLANQPTRLRHAGDIVDGLRCRKQYLVPKLLPNNFLFWSDAGSHVNHDLRAGELPRFEFELLCSRGLRLAP